MKVCMLTTSFPGHEEDIRSPFILELCKALSYQKVSLDVIAPHYPGSTAEENINGIHIHRFSYFFPRRFQVLTSGGGIPSALKRSWLAKLQFPIFFIAFLLKALRYGKRCDVIHAQWSFSALVGLLLKWIYGKPLVMTERGASAHLAMNNWLMRKVLTFIAQHCDFITANSIQQTELFVSLGTSQEKVMTIPNGIDKRFKLINKKKCRSMLHLPLDKHIVLFVGWLIERKNVESLIKAMNLIVKKRKDALCIIIGEGDRKHALQELVRKLRLEPNVSFIGSVSPSTVPFYMNAADVFVLPSLSEGKPNVVAEAMACGVPVVATHVPGTIEILRNEKNGLAVDTNNPPALAIAILKVLNDKLLSKRLSRAGLATILSDQFRWHTSARAYFDIYRKIINWKHS